MPNFCRLDDWEVAPPLAAPYQTNSSSASPSADTSKFAFHRCQFCSFIYFFHRSQNVPDASVTACGCASSAECRMSAALLSFKAVWSSLLLTILPTLAFL